MTKEVVIKSNKYGMELRLDPQVPFPQLLQIIGEKFKETDSFFKNAKMAVAFSGRELTEEEQIRIVDKIMENSSIQIISIMDQDGVQEERMKSRVEAFTESVAAQKKRVVKKPQAQSERASAGREEPVKLSKSLEGRVQTQPPAQTAPPVQTQKLPAEDLQGGFYKGNLRSGQVLECPASVTLIGDVNPGARIVSAGNVVVLGSLKGNACAGADCFIFALDMQPIQLQIGKVIAKSPDKVKDSRSLFKKEKASHSSYAPQIAVAKGGTICIEPMTKGCLDKL